MVPIFSRKDGSFDGQSIKDHIIELSAQHRVEGRVLAFAFLVYDSGDHTMNKIIEDEDYWSSLDKISGHFLSIFYLNTIESYYKKRGNGLIALIFEKESVNEKSNHRIMNHYRFGKADGFTS